VLSIKNGVDESYYYLRKSKRDSKTDMKIVLDGLSGRPVSKICNEYGIHLSFLFIHQARAMYFIIFISSA